MPFALAASVRFGPVCRPWTAFTVGLPLVSHQYRVSDTEYETDIHQTDALRHNTANVKRQYNTRMYRPGSWWRGTVVERRSLAGELSLSCARPAADG